MTRRKALRRAGTTRRRIAAALAAAGALVATSGLVLFTAPAAVAGNGNNGTVKVDGADIDTPPPNNEPHLSCSFDIEWYDFDPGTVTSTVDFELQSPTSGAGYNLSVASGSTSLSFSGADGRDHVEAYTLAFAGTPHAKQGFHVKITVDTTASTGSSLSKHKTYWVGPCITGVAAVAPSVSQASACGVQGSYTIPDTTGVQYLVDGTAVSAGTYPGPKAGTVTATAKTGYSLTNPAFSFGLNVAAAQTCPGVTKVTAVAPSVSQASACGVQGSYTIPDTTGVQYLVDGTAVSAGTYPGPKAGTVTATAKTGYSLTNPAFSFGLNVAAAQTCPTTGPPTNPTVVSPDVTFQGPSCKHPNRYHVNTLNVAGVDYTQHGTAGAGTTVTVDATPESGYAFPAGAKKHWSHAYSGIVVCGTEATKPHQGGHKPHHAAGHPHQQPTVKGVEAFAPGVKHSGAAVPTAVEAGLASWPTTSGSSAISPRELIAQTLLGAGLLMLAAGGWLGLARRRRGVHEA